MSTGYEDIDALIGNQNQLLDQQLEKQNEISQKQTQMNVDSMNRQKEEIDKETTKTNSALYAEYRKASNPYGSNAESMASNGLANSGYAESSRVNLYNAYQKNIVETKNNALKLKSDLDFQINQAWQSHNLALAENALQIYSQKAQLIIQEYEMANNRKQADQAQANWEKEFAYQQQRDAEADRKWEQEFALSKKAYSSRSSSSSKSSGGSLRVSDGDGDDTGAENTDRYGNQISYLKDDVLLIRKADGASFTLTVTPDADANKLLEWGANRGVDLSDYIRSGG